MKDTDIMPFGNHKGKQMKDVPAYYLYALYRNNVRTRSFGTMADVMFYITTNMDAIKQRINEKPDDPT